MNDLNPGIRATVEWLTKNGFKTTDSGDGETHAHECDQPVPYVHMLVPPSRLVREADRLVELLKGEGIVCEPMNEDGTSPFVQASYNPSDGAGGVLTVWNVRLSPNDTSEPTPRTKP